MLKGLILSGAIVGASAVVQAVLLRALPSASAPRLMGTALAATVPVYCLSYELTSPTLGVLPGQLSATPAALGFWNGLLMCVLLFVTWIQCYYHVGRSITLRLITEFERAPSRCMTLRQIERVCGLEVLIGTRLDALLHHGFVVRRGDSYYRGPAGAVAAAIGRIARRIIQLNQY